MPARHLDGIGKMNSRPDEQIQQGGRERLMTDLDRRAVRVGVDWNSDSEQGQ
jgi:hypothetical protein